MKNKSAQAGAAGTALHFKEQLLQAALQTLKQLRPGRLVKESVQRRGTELRIGTSPCRLDRYDRLWVVGSGKASLEMARALCEVLPDRIAGGCIISSYAAEALPCGIETFIGSHPVPTQKSLAATEALRGCLAGMTGRDFFIYVLSGGSSALLEQPVEPLGLADLQQTTEALLRCGAPIEQINIVRKHLSQVKGGRLGLLTQAGGIVLVMSDVIGDDFATIGSGPLFFDPSTFADACRVLEQYGLCDELPAAAALLRRGNEGLIAETPKEPQPQIEHVLIGNNAGALQLLQQELRGRGLPAQIMTSSLSGEAREAARHIVATGRQIAAGGRPFPAPVCLLFGGETTVTVRGRGRGGRNQEMALAALQEIGDDARLFFLSLGTDGIDGPTDAAGARADREIFQAGCKRGLTVQDYLDNNDAYGFFEQAGGLITTGPTGTNLMDITLLAVF